MPIRWLLNAPVALFSALGAALVGGALGLFADGLLAALWPEFWQPGWAQHAGWLACLALAVLGMATRKSHVKWWTEQTTTDDDGDEPRGTPVKGLPAMLLGAFGGAILGVILGGALLMMWFSLALSPWPPAGWFESLRPDTAEHGPHDDDARDSGFGMATSHPMAMAALCVPIAVTSVAGAIFALFGGVRVGSARKILRRRGRSARLGAIGGEAADLADLPRLSPAPRPVPWRIWLRAAEKPAVGIGIGMAFFIAGCVCLAVLGFMAWSDRSVLSAVSALGFSLLSLSIGAAFCYLASRSARTTLRALRYGRLAHATIVQCQEGFDVDNSRRVRRWVEFATAFDELNACWDKPLPIDKKGMRRFMTAAGVFGLVVFVFMGFIGVILSGAAIYVIFVERELSGWFMLLFMAGWWGLLASMARLFLRNVQAPRRAGKWTPKAFGIRPIVDCRARFALPNGDEVEFETKIDLTSRLDAGVADAHDIAVYDPSDPQRAVLLSSFYPPLSLSRSGHWEQAVDLQSER